VLIVLVDLDPDVVFTAGLLARCVRECLAEGAGRGRGHAHGGGSHGLHLHAERLVQLTTFIHFADDVGASDELTLHVELGDRWPVRELLDAISDLAVR
jgi:hypothetical protein